MQLYKKVAKKLTGRYGYCIVSLVIQGLAFNNDVWNRVMFGVIAISY